MRLFIALNLEATERRRLADAVAPLREAGLPVRWVDPDALHLTLKFLGEVPGDGVAVVEDVARRVAASVPPFDLRLGGIGAFPNLQRPRVVWMGVQAPPELQRLQSALEAALVREGFPREERPYSAHLTLGRLQPGARPYELRPLQELAGLVDYSGVLGARTVDIMRSHLSPRGARYERIAAPRLGD
ncbi:MAG TPA: RNA 2',3'-cyclic phosphodiesterase [Longimicrobiales bacterium]|nr:RNA 2',3'-cyclic phosphodiesterase [Longimicrobiales bacterium]